MQTPKPHCSKNTTLSGGGKNTTRIAIISTLLLFLFSFSAYATQQIETLFFNVSQQEFRIGDETTGDLLNNTFPEYIGKWEYNNATNTLTLTDFVWETSAATALEIVGSCTLYVKGTNTFTSTFSGSGAHSVGILTGNSLTISGDKNGILNATGGNTTGSSSNIYGIYASSWGSCNIAISGRTVVAKGHTRAISQYPGTPTFPASRYNWTANTNYNNAEATRRTGTTGTKPRTPYTYSTGDRYIEIAPVLRTFRGNIIVRGGASLIIGK